MKLYYYPLSSYSQKVLMAFHEKGVSFEPKLTQLMDPAVHAEYRKIYPLGKIPCLFADDGHMIPESATIIEYLDGTFDSGTRLIPAEPNAARRARFMERMHDLYLNDPIVTLLFQSWKPESERDPEAAEKAHFRAGVTYDFMEQNLAGKQWAMGDDFGLADCAAAPALFYAQRVKPFDDRPAIAAYWERLQARPSWQKVMAEAQPYLDKL